MRTLELLTTQNPDEDFILAIGHPCKNIQKEWDDFRAFVLFSDWLKFEGKYFLSPFEYQPAAYFEMSMATVFHEWQRCKTS